MRLGITGLPLSGKSTLFEALTKSPHDSSKKAENRIATIAVPDERIDILTGMYNPKKTIYAQIEYFLPGMSAKEGKGEAQWTQVRQCDALIHIIGNFDGSGADLLASFNKLDEELTFADLVVVEKRLERIEADKKRGREGDKEEYEQLLECKALLEENKPIRRNPELAASQKLRGFTFLSAKPMLVLFNNSDEDDALPEVPGVTNIERCIALRCQLEHEIAEMAEEDAKEFLKEYHISEPATNRMIRESYDLLGLISFFTVGEDEVRAWTIKKDTIAVDAADAIHSDIKKGFIRAEIVAYQDLINAKSYAEARKVGTVRLEGKTYIVQDGDIINFRFNV